MRTGECYRLYLLGKLSLEEVIFVAERSIAERERRAEA